MATRQRRSRRSDAVRARRSSRLRKGKSTGRKSLAERAMPPVVVRQPMVRQSRRAARVAENRRRFNLSLGASGAEMRLPAVPAIRLGWRLLSAALSILLLAALYLISTSPSFQVKTVEIQGLNRLSEREINAILNLAGTSIFLVDPATVLDSLAVNFPELVEPSVQVGFPAEVVLEVSERQPLLAWEHEGFEVWIDAQGIAFLPRGEAENLVSVKAIDAPPPQINEQNLTQRLLSPEMVSGILALDEIAPKKTKIVFDQQHGLGWQDKRGWQAFFGLQPTDMQQRLAVYTAMIDMLEEQGIQPSIISVEFMHAPYYR